MKKILGLLIVIFGLFTHSLFAQETVNGHPTYKEKYFHADGVVEWPTFADELIIESNLPVSLYVANIPEFRIAVDKGVLKNISSIYQPQSSYPFTEEDLELQRKFGLTSFYSVQLATKNESELSYWHSFFASNKNLKVKRSLVLTVTNDEIKYRDPFRHLQWYLDRLGVKKAHLVTTGSKHVYLVIGDTGVDPTHEDLPPLVWLYNSFSDKEDGKDDFFHGTWVASIAAAQLNDKGIVGVAPDVSLASIKLLLNGSATLDQVTRGLLKVASWAKGIREKDPDAQFVLNLSFGGIGDAGPLTKAINLLRSVGVFVVAAAGNDHVDLSRVPYVPAGIRGVNAVTATNEDDELASFANYGGNTRFSAPGTFVIGAIPKQGTKFSNATGYDIFSGTSASAPFVSANVALIMSTSNRPMSEEQIRWRLYAGSDFLPNLREYVETSSRINVGNSVIEVPDEPSVAPLDFTAWGSEHSGIQTAWTLSTSMLAFVLHYSQKEFDDSTLKREDVQHISVLRRELAGAETGYYVTNLKDGTQYYFAIQIVNNSGALSPLSRISTRFTREALTVAKRTFEKNGKADAGNWFVIDGPNAGFIERFFGSNIQQWHLMKTTLESPRFVWRFGLKGKPHYNPNQPTDSILLSEVFDTRGLDGLSIRFKWRQELGEGKQNDFVEFYVYELDESNHLANPQFIKRFTVADNTIDFPFEDKMFDLTQKQGKKLVFVLHVLSLTDTNAYGIMLGDFEVRVNKN